MTAHSLPLAGTVASDVCGRWLAPAVTMAAAAAGTHPLAAGSVSLDWTRFPRIAIRTPSLDPSSVSQAREFSLATLRRWGVADRTDDIGIVVSELLTNALRHGVPQASTQPASSQPHAHGQRRSRWPVRLGLVQPGRYVMCAVADPGTRMPVPREPDYLAESGRGLHVINALSDGWGSTVPTDAGKVVWAVFAVRFTQPAPAPRVAARPARTGPRPDRPTLPPGHDRPGTADVPRSPRWPPGA
jgi:anti-sigma regulatory factor (Ser/Thr protein kinase)